MPLESDSLLLARGAELIASLTERSDTGKDGSLGGDMGTPLLVIWIWIARDREMSIRLSKERYGFNAR
jgi:hypothetical protein